MSALSRPATLAALLALKRAHPQLRIVGGNTEVGIEVKFRAARYRHLAAPTHIPELTRIEARALCTLGCLSAVMHVINAAEQPFQPQLILMLAYACHDTLLCRLLFGCHMQPTGSQY